MWVINSQSRNLRCDVSCHKCFMVFNESISQVPSTFAVHFLQVVFMKALNLPKSFIVHV